MFDFWKKPERSTCEVYLRTHREDWFNAVETIASNLPKGTLLDIGSGDLHSTRQILAQAPQITSCDVVEPDKTTNRRAQALAKYCPMGKFYQTTLSEFVPERNYDASMTIHANYYWGKTPNGWSNHKYEECIDKIDKISKQIFILGASKKSEYYDFVEHNPFPEHVHIENTRELLESKGRRVVEIPVPMRFYIEDLKNDPFAARETWKFFNNTENEPAKRQLEKFVDATKDKAYAIFHDVLLIAK